MRRLIISVIFCLHCFCFLFLLGQVAKVVKCKLRLVMGEERNGAKFTV